MPVVDQTAVVAVIAAAEPAVGRWRRHHDGSAADGMPAHITVLFPFLATPLLSQDVHDELTAISAAVDPIRVAFRRCARFPGVLYLVPEPADDIRELMGMIGRRWPQAPLYGGAFDDVVPHLTVARGTESTLDHIESDVNRALPLTATLSELALYAFGSAGWTATASFPLGGSDANP